MSYLHLERKVKPLTSPLVRLLPPLVPTRRLPTLAPRSSTEPPFGPKHPSWRCDTFIVPAAFPRSINGTTKPPGGTAVDPAPATGGRVDLQKALEELYEPQSLALLKEVEVENVEDLKEQQQLYLSVNRYRRPSSATESRLTLVLAHANGFHKETWEPAMSDLLDLLDAPGATPETLPVEEIWSLDCVIQGDSGVLNEEVIGSTFSWADHGRDIVNFLQSYINSPTLNTEPSPAPTTLLSASPATDSPPSSATLPCYPSPPPLRKTHIVGIGHSFGGSGTAFAASSHPSLFSSIILIDPVLPPTHRETSWGTLAGGALVRKDGWTNREEAKEGFLKKGFFRSWDERVLGKYVEFGLRDVEGGNGVRLKTRPRDEAIIFADPLASSSRRAFARLSSLPSSLPVHFIFPDVGRSILEEDLSEIVAQVPHATSTRIPGAGHLVPQDRPRETAAEIARFLRETYPVE